MKAGLIINTFSGNSFSSVTALFPSGQLRPQRYNNTPSPSNDVPVTKNYFTNFPSGRKTLPLFSMSSLIKLLAFSFSSVSILGLL